MEPEKDIFEHMKPGEIKTPDKAYFDQLAQDVINSQSPRKTIPLFKKPVFWLGSAAAVIAIIFMLNENEPHSETNSLLALNDIPTNEVMQYIDENIDEFDADLIAEIVEEENIETIEFTDLKEINKEVIVDNELNFEGIDDQDILDYLIDEEIDFSDFEDDELFI